MAKAPPAHKGKFFLYVIESPSEADLAAGTSEGALLERAASLDGMPAEVRTVKDEAGFREALTRGLVEAMQRHRNRMPIVHISAHGFEGGFGFTNETHLTWDELRDPLMKLNEGSRGRLILCMSSCIGFSGCQMAMDLRAQPFWAIVGCNGSPSWADTAVGFAAFYHHLRDGKTVADAVAALKIASGRSDWEVVSGWHARDSYINAMVESWEDEMLAKLLKDIS